MKRAALAAVVLAALGAGHAHAGEELHGRIVFARGSSLWITDAKGKAKAVELATLPGPASEVRTLRSDADGDTILVDLGGRWLVATGVPAPGAAASPPLALTELPCGPGPARLSQTGVHVLCGDAAGRAQLVRLRDLKVFARDADLTGATVVERPTGRELVWLADGAVVAAPLRDQRQRRTLAPTAPLRGFLASPDGRRGVGVYLATPPQPEGAPAREELMAFPLDGSGARRRLSREGVVLDWSWDGQWLLLQDGAKACIARGLGGHYKCFKGFTAVSLAPDGSYALVLGPRGGGGATAAPARGDEDGGGEGGGEGGDDGEDDAPADDLPKGPLSLYRATLAGNFTAAPSLVETVVDGAALWLPDPPGTSATAATP